AAGSATCPLASLRFHWLRCKLVGMRSRLSRVRLAGTVALTALAACGSPAPPAAPSAPATDGAFAALEHEYVVYFLNRFPVVATYLGGSNFDPTLARIDGALRDHSPAALKEEDAKLAEFRRRFAALDEGALSPRRRIDKNVALAQIDFLLRQHGVRRDQERSLDSYMDEPFRGVDWQIQGMTETGAKTYGTREEWQRVVERVRAIPAYLAVARGQLDAGVAAKNTPDWRMLMQSGLQSSVADAEYFATTLPGIAADDFAGDGRDALLADLRAVGASAADAYLKFRDYVAATFFSDPKREDVNALKEPFRADRFAFGAAEYDWALRNNLHLTDTADELYEGSWPIVEKTRADMVALAREIAAAHGWNVAADGRDAVAIVFDELSADAPRTDDEMLESYVQVGRKLVDYARRTGLFAVPDDYKLDVTVTPPPLRSGVDGAAYYPAPPFKAAGVGRFYVTPTGNDIEQLKQEHNQHAIANLAAHEGFPGHDWNYKVMTEYRDQISPVRWLTPGAVEDSSSMWEDSISAEGWALYSEGLIAEPRPGAPNGFYSPEERLYQLRGLLYRDLRVRIDTGLHTGKLGFDDAVTLFSETVDFLPGSCADADALRLPAKRASCKSAWAAVNRYSRWPTQAITYRLGKDQIVALRARAQRELGAKYSEQRFHLEFMKQGTIAAGYFADEVLDALKREN
ncbi:MAG TPA: DUF885 domain-containing protein, partial [Gammaproteobacteria bacterium]|nr:DUF885 domain-containing protein [Gammaproteobacteria bacterium]